MGDTSNFNVHVPYVPVAYKDRIIELILQYTGGYDHYEDEREGTAISIGANDVSLGSVDELDSEFKELIENGVDVECNVCDSQGQVEGEPCEWFVNRATTPSWCCGTHMYDGTNDYPATDEHPEACPFRAICPACSGGGERHLEGFDFAYSINDEPAYEWLGTLVVHVPGMKDLATECDADGMPVLKNNELMGLIDAATDLEDLRTKIKQSSGAAHFDGMKAFAAAQREATP